MNTTPTNTPSPEKETRSRWGALLIGFMLCSPAYADGVLVQGYRPDGSVVLKMALSPSSAANAQQQAIADCQRDGGQSCGLLNTFKDKCVATVINGRAVDIGEGSTEAAAQQEAMQACTSRGGTCTPAQSGCDPVQTAQRPITAAPSDSFPWWIALPLILIAGGAMAYAGQKAKAVPRFKPRQRFRRPRRTPRPAKGLCDFFWRPPSYKYEATAEETHEAEKHLEAAWEYIEDLADPAISPSASAGQVDSVMDKVTLAAEHVAEARALDRNASITITKKGESFPLRWTDVARTILFVEAKCEIHRAHQAIDRFIAQSHLKQAMSCTIQALSYKELPVYHLQLAHAYLYFGKKEEAKGHARRARELDKDNLDAVKFLTELPNKKPLWEMPRLYELRLFIFIVVAALFSTAVLTFVFGWFTEAQRETVYYLGFGSALAYGLILALVGQLTAKLASIPNTYWHFRHSQMEAPRRKKLNELFERRWKAEARRQW